jgi:hypothetical protein
MPTRPTRIESTPDVRKDSFLHAVACLLADSAEAPALPFCLIGHTFLRFTVPKRIISPEGLEPSI